MLLAIATTSVYAHSESLPPFDSLVVAAGEPNLSICQGVPLPTFVTQLSDALNSEKDEFCERTDPVFLTEVGGGGSDMRWCNTIIAGAPGFIVFNRAVGNPPTWSASDSSWWLKFSLPDFVRVHSRDEGDFRSRVIDRLQHAGNLDFSVTCGSTGWKAEPHFGVAHWIPLRTKAALTDPTALTSHERRLIKQRYGIK